MSSIFTLLIFIYVVSLIIPKNDGFSTKLYYWEGPGTPSYDPTLSKMDRLNRGIGRELAQANRSLTITSNTPIIYLNNVHGLYLMKFALGTPPYEFFAYAHLASEQTWIQCHPCKPCYKQNSPIFEPSKSSTYKTIHCISGQFSCPAFRGVNCEHNVCTYFVSYGNWKVSRGTLSTDMMTIQSTTDQPVKIDSYIFGCGHYNQGKFHPQATGIIGLGRGRQSLITQLDEYTNGKFSYCLSRGMQGGKINFGHNANLQGPDVVKTILTERANKDAPFYEASLKGLTIGTERVNYNTTPGNIIIYTNSILTFFPGVFYKRVVDSITRQITARRVQGRNNLHVCFENINDSFKFIPITAHFAGGADLVLRKFNMFVMLEPEVICLAVAESQTPIWGSLAQIDFLVGFDVPAETMSFKPYTC